MLTDSPVGTAFQRGLERPEAVVIIAVIDVFYVER